MPKKYIPTAKGPYSRHNYEDMEKAVDCVRKGTLSVRAAAKKFGIAKSTLGDRVSGKTELTARSGCNPVLPMELETEVIESVTSSAEKGFGISRKQLLSRIGILCRKTKIKGFKNETPSKHLWYSMKSRHPELNLRKPEKLGNVRARMLNLVVVSNYFDALEGIVGIWNCDETGKQLEHTPVCVIARKGAKNVVGRTGNDRSNITIMACVNAAGIKMPPMLIVKGKTSKSLFGYNTADAPENTVWTYQAKAWMDETISEQWFREVFLKNCGAKRPHS
ncbi:hypothetical protein ScPMuIL_009595 [Solemya velum]